MSRLSTSLQYHKNRPLIAEGATHDTEEEVALNNLFLWVSCNMPLVSNIICMVQVHSASHEEFGKQTPLNMHKRLQVNIRLHSAT